LQPFKGYFEDFLTEKKERKNKRKRGEKLLVL